MTPTPAQIERAAVTHRLKVWTEFIPALDDGSKTFEARKDDRAFCVGDILDLRGWDRRAGIEIETGWKQSRTVTYKLSGPAWGVETGHCILGLSPLTAEIQPAASVAVLVSTVKALERYGSHDSDCDCRSYDTNPCSCGLINALDEAGAAISDATPKATGPGEAGEELRECCADLADALELPTGQDLPEEVLVAVRGLRLQVEALTKERDAQLHEVMIRGHSYARECERLRDTIAMAEGDASEMARALMERIAELEGREAAGGECE